jgi:hypothetical protein
MAPEVGVQSWGSKLGFKVGVQSWGSKLGFKVGVQSWGSRLGFKKASCSIKNRRHPVFGENVVGNAY